MMGERSPYNDYARGVISGLSLGHTREHVMRALLEGITFQLRSYWENAQARKGYEAKRIIVFGGGAKSGFWRQLIADTFGYPSYRLKSNDLGALHLAALSSIALGYYKNLDDAYERIDLSVEDKLEPYAATREKIEKAYKHFLTIEENAKATFISDNIC
jgi:xylulokinase